MPGVGSIEAPGPARTPQPFGERLAAAVAARESQIVLGIDPDPARLWRTGTAAIRSAIASRTRSASAVATSSSLPGSSSTNSSPP